MFVKYKTPIWYIDAMEKFLDKMDKCSTEFGADLKKVYCCADTIVYTNKKMQEAVNRRNKVKKYYSNEFEMLYSKKNRSSNYNLMEAYANWAHDGFFANAFGAKNTMKDLKKCIIASRVTIKQNLAEMHKIWAKWYVILNFSEKTEKSKDQNVRIRFTREQALIILDRLSKALKSDPNKKQFTLSFRAD